MSYLVRILFVSVIVAHLIKRKRLTFRLILEKLYISLKSKISNLFPLDGYV